MELSIVSSVFVNYLIEDVITYVADMGCDGIDIWSGRPHIYRQDYSQAELKLLRKKLNDYDMKVFSVLPAFFRYPHSLSTSNETARQDSLEYMRLCVDNAVTLGADSLLIVPGRTLHKQTVEDAWQRLLDSIDAICRYAADYPIVLGIEPANIAVTDLVLTSDDALKIMSDLEHENLGVVLDSGHLNLTHEDLERAITQLGESLLQFHINDNNGRRQQNLIPGEGTFDFPNLMRQLKTSGFRGALSIELGWEYTLDPIPAVQESVDRMQQWLAEA